jgi:hypothetical protein
MVDVSVIVAVPLWRFITSHRPRMTATVQALSCVMTTVAHALIAASTSLRT